jgi:hypothetical protein
MRLGSARPLMLLALVLVLGLAVAGCGSERPGPESSSASLPGTEPPVSGPQPGGPFWLAGLAVAEDPNDLDDLKQEVEGTLGGALVVSPADCYRGLPAEAGDGYVLGAVGADEAAAEAAAASTGNDELFVAEVTYVCPE